MESNSEMILRQVSAYGRICLPVDLRKKYGLVLGGEVCIEHYSHDSVLMRKISAAEKPPHRCTLSIPGTVAIPKDLRARHSYLIGCPMVLEERAEGILIRAARAEEPEGDFIHRKVDATGRVAIPQKLREKYQLIIEEEVKLLDTPEGILLVRLNAQEKASPRLCVMVTPVGQITLPYVLRHRYGFLEGRSIGLQATESGILIRYQSA